MENYIFGRFKSISTGRIVDVHDPASGEVTLRLPCSGDDEVALAADAAHRAFAIWSDTSSIARADLLDRIAIEIEHAGEDLAHAVTAEVGTPLADAVNVHVPMAAATFRRFAAIARNAMPTETRVGHSVVQHVPVGPVAAITPWNYPLNQSALKLAAALAAGCTVVWKPSEVAPSAAMLLAQAIDRAGTPQGVVNLIHGDRETGAALVRQPRIRLITFTGSTRAGTDIALAAAKDFKRLALEMGGKSAYIVAPGAPLEAAVQNGLEKAFPNSGQTCAALTRMLVPTSDLPEIEAIAIRRAEAFKVGAPLAPDTRIGPMASQAQYDRVRDYIRLGAAEGARALPLAPQTLPNAGFFVAPTIFTDVKPDMRIAREEIFGPVLCLITYSSIEEAVTIANDSAYGLSGGVYAATVHEAQQIAGQIRAGQVEINGASFNQDAPFGGFGASGIGRENGIWGLDEFLEIRSVQYPT